MQTLQGWALSHRLFKMASVGLGSVKIPVRVTVLVIIVHGLKSVMQIWVFLFFELLIEKSCVGKKVASD